MEQTIASATAPDGRTIAYTSVGDGPALVLAAWWTSHLEEDWEDESLRTWVETLAQRHTVVRYDRPGVGLSARVDRPYDLDAETAYLRTVVEAVGHDQVDLMGISCGGPASIRLAAEDPGRIRSLVLYSSYLDGADIADAGTRRALVDLVRANWGLGSQTITSLFLPGATPSAARRFARVQRLSASSEVAADLLDLTFQLDASPYVDRLDLPVLVLHRAHDLVVECRLGRELGERISGATYRELEGTAHSPWGGETADGLEAISSFLSGEPASTAPRRELATVCFIDIVDSTRTLAEIGDSRWRERLDGLTAMMTDEAAHRGGLLVKDIGDGALLRFAVPGEALEFCQVIRARAHHIGLTVRCGLHTGEIELRGDDITGVAVVAAARVVDLADADEILTTRTVADLAAGTRTVFADHGTHDLRGLDGEWAILQAAPVEARAPDQAPAPAVPAPAAAAAAAAATYSFAGCVLDVDAYELRRAGEVVAVEPQVFDLLRHLVEHPGELLTKDRLLDEIWGDRFVSESALTSRIRSARLAVGDDGRRQEIIHTVHGRGYRFVADLT